MGRFVPKLEVGFRLAGRPRARTVAAVGVVPGAAARPRFFGKTTVGDLWGRTGWTLKREPLREQ